MLETYSIQNYKNLLSRMMTLGRQTVSLCDRPSHGLILRHDVDYSPEWAAEIASVNQELGIRATFCLLVDTPFYNLFSTASQKALRHISGCGQDIGLHVRCNDQDVTTRHTEHLFSILQLAASEAKRVVAWHNPPEDVSALNRVANEAEFVCAYDTKYFGPKRYFSDSNLRHTPASLLEEVFASQAEILQVLLHPINWVSGAQEMEAILNNTCASRIETQLQGMLDNRVWRTNHFCHITRTLQSILQHHTNRSLTTQFTS